MPDDTEALLRRRLQLIREQGVNQSIYSKDQNATLDAEIQGKRDIAEQQKIALANVAAQQNANNLLSKTNPVFVETGGGGKWVDGGNITVPVGGDSNTGGKKGSFESFMNAIQGQESGGSYSARNRDSGAMGKYQIMPGNIAGSGGWDKEALGRNVSVSQFMGSPQIQDAVARYKLKQYYDQYGAAGAAVAWYAGPGNAKKYVAANGKGFSRAQGKYPSISRYANDILRRMGYK